jgi:hypothetical protein
MKRIHLTSESGERRKDILTVLTGALVVMLAVFTTLRRAGNIRTPADAGPGHAEFPSADFAIGDKP